MIVHRHNSRTVLRNPKQLGTASTGRHSWVVFYDGAEFHWLQGRYNFPVKKSHLIDSSAFAARFRRVSNDAVLLIARGQSSGWNEVHYVVHDDAITFLADEEEPCAGFNSDPWRTF